MTRLDVNENASNELSCSIEHIFTKASISKNEDDEAGFEADDEETEDTNSDWRNDEKVLRIEGRVH